MTIDISPDLILGMLISDFEHDLETTSRGDIFDTMTDHAIADGLLDDNLEMPYSIFNWMTPAQHDEVNETLFKNQGYITSQLTMYFAQRRATLS